MKTLAASERRSSSAVRHKAAPTRQNTNFKVQQQQSAIRKIVQTKLKLGRPNDHYEAEADSVADKVVGQQPVAGISALDCSRIHSAQDLSSPEEEINVQSKNEEEEEEVQLKSDEPEEKEELAQASALNGGLYLQRVEDEEEQPAQTQLLQRQIEEEEEPLQAWYLQAKLLQREQDTEEEEEPIQAKGRVHSVQAASDAVENPGAGVPLRPDVRQRLETGIGADFGDVRVHQDEQAQSAAAAINARAFTHKNNIWLGAGQSQSDIRLMAHEATHVVQQRGGMRSENKQISQAAPKVQRWNPFSAIADAVSDAVEWVGDSIERAVEYVKEQAAELVSSMPGYSLFTVINGEDPITGRHVDRNGRNFIEAGLDVIPNGRDLKRKLEQEGALEEAAQWLDEEIRLLDFDPAEIVNQLSNFWNSLTIADATRLESVLRRFTNIITAPVNRIIRFATNIASGLLGIIKDYVVSALINFVKERTNAYPLLTQILERDPISNEPVLRTPMGLLRGFMQLSETGQEQLRQMEASGSLQRAADWLNGAIERLNLSWEIIRETFSNAWDAVTISSLLNPPALFRRLYNLFAGPVGRIARFVWEVVSKVLSFIKEALLDRLVDYARGIRGYPLIGVILGSDPISQRPIERTTPNIVRGFMSLMENGEQQYQQMEQTGAIARMAARVEEALARLNFTWEYIRGLFSRAWNSFSLQDLAVPFEAFRRIMNIFAGPIRRLVAFVWEIIKVVLEVVMQVMNFPIDLIRNIISRAIQAIGDIKRDPIGFLMNMLRAVKTGFQQFFGNILTHLINGVTGWLFSELREAGINPPADFSFRSILGFVLEVLGITIERIWQKLAERIGEERVARIRGMIDRLTGIWTFVRDVVTRGPVAIWEYIQERISNLWDTVLEAVRNWVVTRIVERVVTRLLSMLDPTGIMAVINGFIAFYNAVQSFIRYLREMLEIVNSFVVGLAELARGNVTIAANFLENSLARAMPVAIGFLANQVGLSGIGRRIAEMIERVREVVDRALTWLVDRAVSAGSSLLNMGRAAVGAVRNWWQARKNFRTDDGESHSLQFEGQGSSARLILRSNPVEIRAWIASKRSANLPSNKQSALNSIETLVQEMETIKNAPEGSSPSRSMEAVMNDMATHIQTVQGSDILAEAKNHNDFKTGWFVPGDLYEFIQVQGSVSRSTAGNRVSDWKSTGVLRTWQSNDNDSNKKFSFVEASKDRKIPTTSRRTLYGFGNNITKDSSDGWAVMVKTLDEQRSKQKGINDGYITASAAQQNTSWYSSAIADDRFRKNFAVFECARKRNGKASLPNYHYFTWSPAIMGHDDSQHEGAAGYWNDVARHDSSKDRNANMRWNQQVSSYWGPEHSRTSSWSGGFAPDYEEPTKNSHPMWWNRNDSSWYGQVNSNYTFFLE